MSPRLELAQRQIEFARGYVLSLLADVGDDDWFRQPAGAPTHLAWQLGHLAMAQYGLCLFRQRGRGEGDAELMSGQFRKLFSRGSEVAPDPASYPRVAEIRGVFDRVLEQVRRELPTFSEASLDEPVDMPYAGYATKYGALLFSSHHEMLHAGQIGLLRRLLGKPPVR
jgi:hypothetical protein